MFIKNLLKPFILLSLFALIFSCTNKNEKKQLENKLDNTLKLKDSLAFQLCQIYGLDQGIRKSPGMPNKWDFMLPIDSINFFKIMDFIKDNGYPNKDLLGEKNYASECVQASAGVVFLHTPHILVNNKKYVDILLKEVEKGNLSRETIALFMDKYYWIRRDEYDNSEVLYGTQFGKPCLKNRKKSDSVRAEIGLAPLKKDDFQVCL